jgi:hypothetical protein
MYSFFNLVNRLGGWLTPHLRSFTPGKDPVPLVQEAGWSTGPVLTGAENLAFTGIRFPERRATRYSDYSIRPYAIYNFLQRCTKNMARHSLPDSKLLRGALQQNIARVSKRETAAQCYSTLITFQRGIHRQIEKSYRCLATQGKR